MEQILSDLLAQVFMLLGIVLASFTVALLKKYLGTAKMKAIAAELEANQEIVDTAVLFVQQVYWYLDGPAKAMAAAERASIILEEKGIALSPEELQAHMEAGLKMLKLQFGEEWDTATKPQKTKAALEAASAAVIAYEASKID